MRIAIKRDATEISADGRIAGHDAGATLVRRFVRLYPNVQIIGARPRRCQGFDVIPLAFIDPEDTVIINMDVLDSMDVWNTIYQGSGGTKPNIMNFVWWPTQQVRANTVTATTLALSCALFPTFANSERTGSEIQELVRHLTVGQVHENSQLAWVNLGFRLDHVQPRQPTETPVVLYPAIYLTDVKRPGLFKKVVESVHARTPIQVEMRLVESNLVSERAFEFSQIPWIWVGPLVSQRASYWEALAHTTAFLATAEEESYGLSYVEAMGAGSIGVFPDLPWARSLLPSGYPFLYQNKKEAENLLYKAVTEPEVCRASLDRLVPEESFTNWVHDNHSDDAFDREISHCLHEWFDIEERVG